MLPWDLYENEFQTILRKQSTAYYIMPKLTVMRSNYERPIYSDEENVSKQLQSNENLFVERESEQRNGGPLSLKMNILHICRRHKI